MKALFFVDFGYTGHRMGWGGRLETEFNGRICLKRKDKRRQNILRESEAAFTLTGFFSQWGRDALLRWWLNPP